MKRSMTRQKLATLAGAFWLMLVVAACSDVAASSPLQDAQRSPEALAEAALAALAASDDVALAALSVRRDEYETLLWPSLPDTAHVTFEFVWGMSEPRTRKARRAQMGEYGGLPLELMRVELGEEVEEYDTFTFFKDSRMWVRNTDTGAEGQLPLMDVLVEMDGGWKFLNFRDEL